MSKFSSVAQWAFYMDKSTNARENKVNIKIIR